MHTLTRRSLVFAAAGAMSGASLMALAQTATGRYSMVVPFPAGGPADVAARVMQPLLAPSLGETVIVENFGGAGGSIGVSKMLAAPATGQTFMLTTVAEPILPPLAMKGVRYKPADLRLVAPLADTAIALVVRADLPVQTFDDFLRYAREVGKAPLSYATPGSGTLYHLMGEHFRALTHTRLLHVPYKGLAPAMNDLLSKQVDAAFLPLAGSTLKLIESGKIRALAVSTTDDVPVEMALPRISASAGLKEFQYTVWTGIFVPRATPEPAVQRLHGAVDKALRGPEFSAYTKEAGGRARERALSLPESDALYQAEAMRLQRIFQLVGLTQE